MTTPINADQVAAYLLDNPHFFEDHADLLGTIRVTSPVLGRTVSLQERQMEVLREKLRGLELSLSRLMHRAQSNEDIATKLYAWVYGLLRTHPTPERAQMLVDKLRNIFDLPQATLRLWSVEPAQHDAWFAAAVPDEVRRFTDNLKGPYCGSSQDIAATQLLDDPKAVRSIAIIPVQRLASDQTVGVLVLASDNADRFTIDMSTDFLCNIGDTTTAALSFLFSRQPELTIA